MTCKQCFRHASKPGLISRIEYCESLQAAPQSFIPKPRKSISTAAVRISLMFENLVPASPALHDCHSGSFSCLAPYCTSVFLTFTFLAPIYHLSFGTKSTRLPSRNPCPSQKIQREPRLAIRYRRWAFRWRALALR